MSEFLHGNSELPGDDDSVIERLAGSSDDGDYGEGDDDDGYYDEEDYYDDYDDEYEEQHYGEERVDFDEEKLILQYIPLPAEIMERYAFFDELPRGVAVMGGVARSIAREIITGEREPIRDIDLVNIISEEGKSEVDYDTIDALSRKFMPDDYAFGHGMEDDTIDNYFMTRDFTINQCLIKDGKLIVSNFAYNDFQENIIRPTYFEHPYIGDDVSCRLFLKALMMRSVLFQITDSVPLIEDLTRPERVSTFNIALFLNKAMSRGAETARIFTEDLADWDIIPEEYAGRPVALAKMILQDTDIDSFEFRSSVDRRFSDIQECADMDGFFIPPAMSRYHASNPIIRRAIAEYEDDLDGLAVGEEERVSGRYTQAEYDDINRYSISQS